VLQSVICSVESWLATRCDPQRRLRVGVALLDRTALADVHELMRHGLDALVEIYDEVTLRTSSTGHVDLP
jgi:hypothetical protein